MLVQGLNPADLEYGYRMSGPNQPENGHRFDEEKILLDPYAKAITGRGTWRQHTKDGGDFPYRGTCLRRRF